MCGAARNSASAISRNPLLMLPFQEHYNLKDLNTFGLAEEARYFLSLDSEAQLPELLKTEIYKKNQVLWLGGGSNMLLTQAFPGLVIKLNFKGKQIDFVNQDEAIVSAKAGENWHEFVQFCLKQNLGGLENLSLIPGNVGTAPIQNIGAYGVEIKDYFYRLRAFDLQEKIWCDFNAEDCDFGYRWSIFKGECKGRYVITEVQFKLSRKDHILHTSYGAIQNELERLGEEASIQSVAKAVINIRESKLPNPAEIGNSGSFFKNPVVPTEQYEDLKKKYPELVAYPFGAEYKLAAGWLIEKAGWKGFRRGDAGVHNKQALVLVNYGKAKGAEIKALSEEIQASIYNTFAVTLEAEVNII